MSVAHRIHLRRHADIPLERRQLGHLISDVTGALIPGLGLGNTKTNKPNQPTQPPGQGNGNNNTPAAPNPGTTPTVVANLVSTPTGGSGGNSGSGGSSSNGGGGSGSSGGGGSGGSNGGSGSGGSNGGGSGGSNGGGGGSSSGGGSGTATGPGAVNTASPGASNRTNTPSSTPSPGGTNSNNGSSGGGSDSNTGTINVGSSPGPGNEGVSNFTPGTRTSGDPSGSNPSTTGNTLSDQKAGTPTGPIAAAVILSLLFVIAVVVFILRRRSSKRRDELAVRWWFTRNPASQPYGDNEALNNGSSSRRSSFATTLDHSRALFIADTTIPPPPPMAEIGRPIGTDPALILDINTDPNRFSIGSANSHNSQFLVVHHRESLQQENSASLMSCTESFPFPKPPLSPADHTFYPKSCEGSRAGSPKKRESEVPYVASPTSTRSTVTIPQIQLTFSDPFADNNPFEDLVPLPVPDSGIETVSVRRPFVPQLHDELEVDIGDSVRIVQTFDDGWAFVEKMSAISKGEQGLVPLNCLLDLAQNPLLEGKRMSSQGAKNT